MLRLPPHWLLPSNTEPRQILEDAGHVLLAAAGYVDVLDAHQEAPAKAPRRIEAGQRRQRMAKMQRAVGARRETKDRN